VSDTDPFPRDRFAATVRRLPRYAKLAWRLGRDPLLSRARRAAVIAAAGYLVSPVDAVPDVIPVVGQLDDIAVVLAALRFAIAGLDPARRREHLDAVGLRDGDLAEDLRTVGVATAWTLRAGGRTTARVIRVSAAVAGKAAGTARHAAPVVAGTATGAASAIRHHAPATGARVLDTAKPIAGRAASLAGSAPSATRSAVTKGASAARSGVSRLPRPRRHEADDDHIDRGAGI
jgi:uncharacterized membrane protein YkvA (DUF1232 family)